MLYFGTEKTSVQSYAELFKELQKDDSVQGVIIEIDSGGGHDSAVPLPYYALLRHQ